MTGVGAAHVLRANARTLPLADNTVDLVVTSPPYFALRSYQDGGSHYPGQIGDEPTPAEFVTSLLDVTRECVRVLKPSGSLWVNLGDKYAMDGKWGGSSGARNHASAHHVRRTTGIRSKSLIGIPWRYALACIDDLGLILRAEVIWSKPNGLPESVTDRVRRSHEQWFHFVSQPRYFSAVDEIREPHAEPPRAGYGRERPVIPGGNRGTHVGTMDHAAHRDMGQSALGKLPGSVWTVPTEPLRVPDHLGVDHFAAFPTEWPKRIIAGWSPAGVCVACGEGRRPVVARESNASAWRDLPLKPKDVGRSASQGHADADNHARTTGLSRPGWRKNLPDPDTITGYACACPEPTAPTRPSVVLDPFGGTGTTALAAKALGRHGITVDMSADYCRLAAWRTNDRNQLATIIGIPRTPPPDPDQLNLFGDTA